MMVFFRLVYPLIDSFLCYLRECPTHFVDNLPAIDINVEANEDIHEIGFRIRDTVNKTVEQVLFLFRPAILENFSFKILDRAVVVLFTY